MKKLLVYAHYFYPDVASTGQILTDLCDGLKDKFDITVICAVPSYTGKIEDKYKTKKMYFEEYNGIKIVRVKVSEFNKTNKISRIKNILDYFFNARIATRKIGKQDLVFTISQPPVLGGMLGVYGKRKKHAKLIYNIQDFNPEQIIAVKYSRNKFVTDLMMYFDKKTCRKSDLIITVGSDLVETVNRRFNYKNVPKTIFINNWIDDKQIYPLDNNNEKILEFKKKYGLENKFVFMYSGNIGLYYDLENIFKVINKFKKGTKTIEGKEVIFTFIGDGSILEKLKKYKEDNKMDNVVFIPYQDKKDLIYSLNSADIHFCVNAKGIKGVSCPSKYYGIAAVAKPVIAVLEKDTEIRNIIEKTESGFISDPGDYKKLEKNIREVINLPEKELSRIGTNGYKNLENNLTKTKSIEKYKNEMLKLEDLYAE